MLEEAFFYSLNNKLVEAIVSETGKLTFGSTDKENKNYTTQADYYYEDNQIEVRIPWGLLNFSDPSNLLIHDDYYKHYGVEAIPISNIYVGATTKSNVNLKKATLKKATVDVYHEELKDSYYIVKESWCK